MKSKSEKQSNHYKYVSISVLFLSLSSLDFLGCYEIPFYPIGEFTSIIFLTTVTFAIVRHQLLDINIVIKKSLVYSFLVSILTIIYLLIVLLIERIFNSFIGYQSLVSSLITAIFVAAFFIPLKNRIQNIIDFIFFKNTHLEVMHQNEMLKQEIIQTERLKSIAILASGIAHEIKNPLTSLKTFTEYLPKRLHDPEFTNKFIPLVTSEVNRIDKLVHELLDFSKPSSAVLQLSDIHNVINNSLELTNNSFNQNNIILIKEFFLNHKPFVNIDTNQFKQALLNIVLNSIDAMPDGGSLKIQTYVNQHTFQLRILDTGCGIEPTDIPHIFDPFYSKKSKGTGLGLSITHEIIKNHQGKIFVESKKNFGTTFIIELPYNSPLL